MTRRVHGRGLRAALAAALAVAACATLGCSSLVAWAAIPVLYREAELPQERSLLDVPYRIGAQADPDRHRLDLFLPEGEDWPLLVFVHGGGWRTGHRALRAGGADVYRNIGRFLAARGVGAAVIGYRLQPEVDWRAQVDDVAHAVAFLHAHLPAFGGDPDALFLSGHSAGAHLSARAGLDRERLAALGVPPEAVCGIVPVSGAALDLGDARTWELGADPDYYAARFADGSAPESWRTAASVAPLVDAGAPPALVLYAGGESQALIRQAHALAEAYAAAGVPGELVEVPGEDHQRIVLTLSRDDRVGGASLLRFVRETSCDSNPSQKSRTEPGARMGPEIKARKIRRSIEPGDGPWGAEAK